MASDSFVVLTKHFVQRLKQQNLLYYLQSCNFIHLKLNAMFDLYHFW